MQGQGSCFRGVSTASDGLWTFAWQWPWLTLVKRRTMHILILAINFLEGSLTWDSLNLLGRRPNQLQRRVHARLWALLSTCDLTGGNEVSLVPGRSGPEFVARLKQLERFAQRHHLLEVKGYVGGPKDFEKSSVGKTMKEDDVPLEHQPYSSLNAERLKLVGRGRWHLDEWLEDDLYLPYLEPKVLHHGGPVDFDAGPNLAREDRDEYLKLAQKWHSLGLLGLTTQPPEREAFVRIFNARKDDQCDRQIGDRRRANMIEYSVKGPSQFLPGGYLICSIHIPRGKAAYAAITDRKDFYHQSRVSNMRAMSNVTPFAFSAEELKGIDVDAIAMSHERPRDRLAGGDRLGFAPRTVLQDEDRYFPCFRSLLQGDHLGMEFALSAHGSMLRDAGLLEEGQCILGHHPFPEGPVYQGLVIDDVFLMSIERPGLKPEDTIAVQRMRVATDKYEKHDVLGSPEKDIVGSCHFKVVGAEVDSSSRTRSLGVATVGAPLEKRIALIALTLRAAQLPVISAALSTRLAGNWTSVFMYRRCLACVMNEIYSFGGEESSNRTEVL
eukprot:Skav208968  [mRNA]  locus=scaffold1134:70399:72057:+ [translate_table: standard]